MYGLRRIFFSLALYVFSFTIHSQPFPWLFLHIHKLLSVYFLLFDSGLLSYCCITIDSKLKQSILKTSWDSGSKELTSLRKFLELT